MMLLAVCRSLAANPLFAAAHQALAQAFSGFPRPAFFSLGDFPFPGRLLEFHFGFLGFHGPTQPSSFFRFPQSYGLFSRLPFCGCLFESVGFTFFSGIRKGFFFFSGSRPATAPRGFFMTCPIPR